MTRTALGLTLVAAMSAAACLQKDATSTIYLRQDGSFDWVVLERNVRSDASDEASRLAEEAEYVEAVSRGNLGVVNSLLALGAQDVHVRWLRGTRPYAVTVDGRFDSLPGAFDRALAGCEFPHANGLTHSDGVTTWTLRLDVGTDGSRVEAAGHVCGDGVAALSNLLDGLRVVLESGTFTAATGFSLQGGDTATFDEDALETAVKDSGVVELSLSWR